MTTAVQTALPRTDYFGSCSIDSSSYPGINYPDSILQKPAYGHGAYDRQYPASAPSSAPSSPSLTYSSFSHGLSYASTPASVVSIGGRSHLDYTASADDDLTFPEFEHLSPPPTQECCNPPKEPLDETALCRRIPTFAHDPFDPSKDDHAVDPEPSRHVDYLSHDWREEDIWASWSYIIRRRKDINNSLRLENASWRTWAKTKHQLKTVSPESLNWLKDCDTTWLYGPLQTAGRRSLFTTTPPPSRLSHSSSFTSKKPILKKKSASALMLERSLSQRTLLARASEILRSQQSSPALLGNTGYRRPTSDYNISTFSGSSVLNTPALEDVPPFCRTRSSFGFTEPPTPSENKHVSFVEEVRQVQAVDSEDDDKDDLLDETALEEDEVEDEDEDDGLMMAPSKARPSRGFSSRNSYSGENITIVPLPPTTLKRQSDPPQPELPEFWLQSKTISPSPSQETLRPPRPSHNFLLDDDPEVDDEPWQPRSYSDHSPPSWEDEGYEPSPNMRRTESGMFMPYDEDAEDEGGMNNNLLGRAVYAVNTIRDIAHVVWNVGWHREKERSPNR